MPDVRKWREQGASRPHHDARRAAFDEVPLVVALPLAHARVHDRDQIAEAAAEATHRLRRKRDLGHKHAGRAPLGKRLLDGAQVELVLPEPVTPSTTTTSPQACSRARSMAARALSCPGVSAGFGEGVKPSNAMVDVIEAEAEGAPSEVSASVPLTAIPGKLPSAPSAPRMRRRRTMRTTPFDSRARRVDEIAPISADRSDTRSSPVRTAATIASWRTAFLRGSNAESSGPATTHRSSTSPTFCSSKRHRPSRPCTIRGMPPGGVNRRTQEESGAM